MKLTPEQLQALPQRMMSGFNFCRNCGGREFSADPTLRRLVAQEDEIEDVPVFALTCNSCGHVRLFSAQKLGLVEPPTSGEQPVGN